MAQTQTPAYFFSSGTKIEYTPNAAVYAGDIVVIGSMVGVAEVDIAASALGEVTIRGAVNAPKDTSTFTAGDAVYWNATGSPVTGTVSTGAMTSTQGSNKYVGRCLADAATGVASVKVNLAGTAVNSATVAGSMTADDITGTDSSLGISGFASTQGGAIALVGGASSTSANAGGAITGVGGTPGLTGIGGAITWTGGAGGATSGAGGAVTLVGGVGTNGNSAGGLVGATGGAGQGSAAGGLSKIVGGAGGATGAGGAAQMTGGAGGATSGTGGACTITGGAGTNGNAVGGAAQFIGGAGNGSGAGGACTITSGAAGATGVAGTVDISVGAATAGNGSAMTLTAGNGAGGTASGGNINLVPGTAVSTGTPGELTVNSVAGTVEVTYTAPLMTTAVPSTGTAQPIYIATRAMRLKKAYCSVVTHGTSETISLTKDASAAAPGAGTAMLAAVMTPAANNTPVTQAASSTIATATLAAGDRISFLTGGTIGSAAGLTITMLLVPC